MSSSFLSWSYWTATLWLLATAHLGWAPALDAAIALTAIQVLHFAWRARALSAFPVQVRLSYLGLLLAGCWEPLGFIHTIQLVGVAAVVSTSYCLLARLLALAPWNRAEPLTLGLVARALFTPPLDHSILRELAEASQVEQSAAPPPPAHAARGLSVPWDSPIVRGRGSSRAHRLGPESARGALEAQPGCRGTLRP